MMNAGALDATGINIYSHSQQGPHLRDQPVTSGLRDPAGGEVFMQCNHEVRPPIATIPLMMNIYLEILHISLDGR